MSPGSEASCSVHMQDNVRRGRRKLRFSIPFFGGGFDFFFKLDNLAERGNYFFSFLFQDTSRKTAPNSHNPKQLKGLLHRRPGAWYRRCPQTWQSFSTFCSEECHVLRAVPTVGCCHLRASLTLATPAQPPSVGELEQTARQQPQKCNDEDEKCKRDQKGHSFQFIVLNARKPVKPRA